ncbi:MAG: hypothetical protein M3Q39_01310 [Actinomycetota bacterium]|nr:hypothetical protein [Actinomycetota bacterium]
MSRTWSGSVGHRPIQAAGWATALVDALPALGATAAWIALAVLVAASTFRWDPRR